MRRVEAALVACLALAGCAGPARFGGEAQRPPFRDPALRAPQAATLVEAGRSRREDVAARLGPAETVRFDSGYEVWVYRWRGPEAATRPELVLLFDPQGVLSKSRVREPAPGAR